MAAPPYPKIENLYASLSGGEARAIGVLKRPARTGLIARWLCTEKIDGTNIRVSLEPEGLDARGSAVGDSWEKIRLAGPWVVRFYGRTDKAQTPDFIQEYLEATFALDKLKQLWQGRRSCTRCDGAGREDSGQPAILSQLAEPFPYACDCVEPYPITLYGEAYGAGIHGGGDYRRDGGISFRLFDVLVGEKHWLTWENVVGVAQSVGIKTVPPVDVIEYGSPAMAVRSSIAIQADIVDFVRDGFKSLVAEEEGTPRLAEGIVARTDPYLFDNNGRRVVFKTKTKDF